MPCPVCHLPALVHQLKLYHLDWEKRHPRWMLVFICHSETCWFRFRAWETGITYLGRRRFGLPLKG